MIHHYWQPTPEHLTLAPDQVEVWLCRLDIPADKITRLGHSLTEEERARAARLQRPEKRKQFIITRGYLRQKLSLVTHQSPESFIFAYHKRGKPFLPSKGNMLSFSIAHSYHLALIAITVDHPLGIDIEKIRGNIRQAALVKRWFSQAEQAAYKTMPANTQLKAFYTGWTRKEAVVKATGNGVGQGLSTFTVSLDPQRARTRLCIHGQMAKNWLISTLPVNDDYIANLAVASARVRVNYWL